MAADLSAWSGCLKDIQQLLAATSNDQSTRFNRVRRFCDADPTKLSEAASRQLVQRMQAPSQLCTALVTAARGTGLRSSDSTTVAVLYALSRFMVVVDTSSRFLCDLLWQQIEQTGVLQLLPGLLSEVAEELAASAAPSGGSSSSSSGAATAATSSHSSATAASSQFDLCMLAEALGRIVNVLQGMCCKNSARLTTAVQLAPATLQMFMAALQSVSQQLQQGVDVNLRALGSSGQNCLAAVLSTIYTLTDTAECEAPNDSSFAWFDNSEATGVLESPFLLTSQCAMAAVMVFAVVGSWEQLDRSDAQRSGSSTTTRTDCGNAAAASWAQVDSNREQHVTPCHKALCELLRVSDTTLLFTAGMLRCSSWDADDAPVSAVLKMYMQTHTKLGDSWTSTQPAEQVRQRRLVEQQLHMHMPCVWAAWASWLATKSNTGGMQYEMATLADAAAGIACGVSQWAEMSGCQQSAAQRASQQQQQQQAGASTGHAACRTLSPTVLGEVLPLMLQVLGALLQQPVERQQRLKGTITLHCTSLLQLLQLALRLEVSSDSVSMHFSAAAAAALIPQVVQDNMLHILQTLDAGVRSMCRTVDADCDMEVEALVIMFQLLVIYATLDYLSPAAASAQQDRATAAPAAHTNSMPGRVTHLQAFTSILNSILKLSSILTSLASGGSTSSQAALAGEVCCAGVSAVCLTLLRRSFKAHVLLDGTPVYPHAQGAVKLASLAVCYRFVRLAAQASACTTTTGGTQIGSLSLGDSAPFQQLCSMVNSWLGGKDVGIPTELLGVALFTCRNYSAAIGLLALSMTANDMTLAFAATATHLTTSTPQAGGSSSSNSMAALEAQLQQQEAQPEESSISNLRLLPILVLWIRSCLPMAQQHFTWSALKRAYSVPTGIDTFHAWLSLPTVSQQLSAAGYQPQQLLTDLLQLKAVAQQAAAAAAAEGAITAQSTARFFKKLEEMLAVGQRLCLPVPDFCNNPACDNVSGPSDSALVGGLACVCGGCLTAWYCSRACQRVHWKAGHKPVCQALAAAAAAAAKAAAEAAAAKPPASSQSAA